MCADVDRTKYLQPMQDYVQQRKNGPEPMIKAFKVLLVHEHETEMPKLAKILNDTFTFLNIQCLESV